MVASLIMVLRHGHCRVCNTAGELCQGVAGTGGDDEGVQQFVPPCIDLCCPFCKRRCSSMDSRDNLGEAIVGCPEMRVP